MSGLATISEELGVTSVDNCAVSGVCKLGTAFAIKVNSKENYKFYVLNDDGNMTTLIMNKNLGTNVAWGTNYNEGPLLALQALKERTKGWTNIDEYNYELDFGSCYTEGTGIYSGEFVQNVRARLPKKSELDIDEIGCVVFEMSCADWVKEGLGDNNTKGYWLSGASDTDYDNACDISSGTYGYDMGDSDISSSNKNGIRPVITLSKKK